MKKILPTVIALAAFIFTNLHAQQLAFPGAVGFGAYASGGRTGTVYHVTNLNDSGAGSFRDAVSQGNRIVVFDVGGYINLASAVSMHSDITVAGQTAPGDGIGIMSREVSFDGRNNIIFRDFRFRQGTNDPDSSKSGINLLNATNVILDHVSIEFAQYDNIDAVGCSDITIMNSIDADPIGQQFCAHMEHVGANCCFYNDVFADLHGRGPLDKINAVFINNASYNYGYSYTVANTSGIFSHDIVNNYFIAGPATTTPGDDFFQMNSGQSCYSSGNLLDSSYSSILSGSATAPSGVTVLNSPWSSWTTTIPTLDAASALKQDISLSGTLPHDQVDNYVMNNVKSYGATGPNPLPKSQTVDGLGNNGYGILNGGTAPINTSGDGIADYWKVANGLSTNVYYPLTNTADGYTLLEHYLNWLADPHAVATNGTLVDVDLSQYTSGFVASPTFTLSGAVNGTVSLNADGHTAQFTPTGDFTGLGSFNFTVTDSAGSSMTNGVVVLIEPSSTTNNPPVAPTGLSAAGGNLVVNLNWTQSTSPGITGNNVYRSTGGNGGPYNLLANLGATTSYSDTAVNAGSTYYYSVTAVNSNGESALSAYAGATTVPPAPAGLTATAGNNQVALSWTAAGGASSYNVKRATTSGGPYTTIASGVTATSYTDTTAVNGTTYYYVVSAVNSAGESANSSEVSATPTAPSNPNAPTNLSASVGHKKITLTWTQSNSPNITTNNVYRATISGGPYTRVASLAATTSYVNTGLMSGTTYYYVVTAVNSANLESPNSNQASATAK